MNIHGVDLRLQMKRMREAAPEIFRSFVDFDQKAFAEGALPAKTKELIALAVAHATQCPWCLDVHSKKAKKAGATEQEVVEATFVAMAMTAGAAWTHGALALHARDEG